MRPKGTEKRDGYYYYSDKHYMAYPLPLQGDSARYQGGGKLPQHVN